MARLFDYASVSNSTTRHALDQYKLGTVWPIISDGGSRQVHLDLFLTDRGKKVLQAQEDAGLDLEAQMDVIQTLRMSPETAKALGVALIEAAGVIKQAS